MSEKPESEKEQEQLRQYYFEGYYDSAFSMPADAEGNHSFSIRQNSAPPAFPPQGEKKRSKKRWIVVLLLVLLLALCVALAVQFALSHELDVTRENGRLNITISRKPNREAVQPGRTAELPQTAEPEGAQQFLWTGPDKSEWTGLSLGLRLRSASDKPMEMTEAFESVRESVVAVIGVSDAGNLLGSGVIISEDGYLITSEHIVSSAYTIYVLVDGGEEYEARIVGMDRTTDLAVLKISAKGLHKAVLGNPSDLQVGETVMAVGFPLTTSLTMTDGVVSSMSTTMKYGGCQMDMLLHTAAIGDGNSGGALVDLYGRVVGITSRKISASVSALDGLNVALPMNVVKPVVDELLYHGYVEGRPSLGVETVDMSLPAATYYGVPVGAYITAVEKNSDAYFKGLVEGNIIVSFNGVEVRGKEQLEELVGASTAGDTVRLGIFSVESGYFFVDVTIGGKDASNA